MIASITRTETTHYPFFSFEPSHPLREPCPQCRRLVILLVRRLGSDGVLGGGVCCQCSKKEVQR